MRAAIRIAICAPFFLAACGTPHPGPKLIEADGARYVACGGAMWLRDQGNSKDPITMTYEVVYQDADGRSHSLKGVHTLRVTDLPADTPECQRLAKAPPTVPTVSPEPKDQR
jgi:hypothetical protein